MEMIQFKDELVPLKQCKIGSVVALDYPPSNLLYGHITGYKDLYGDLSITVQDETEESYNHYPKHLLWNV